MCIFDVHTKPVFSRCMSKAIPVLLPSSEEVHCAIHPPLKHLQMLFHDKMVTKADSLQNIKPFFNLWNFKSSDFRTPGFFLWTSTSASRSLFKVGKAYSG